MSRLISDWRQGWKFYSTWFFATLAVMPDVYNALLAAGLLSADVMPETAAWIVRLVAIAGIVSRFISQAKPDAAKPEIH